MARVFLSHATADAALAHAVRDALAAAGHDVFLDHAREGGIAAGVEWERVLYEELERADAVVCVVTPRHVASRWCFAEVALAKARGRRVVPLAAEAGARHPLLHGVHELAWAADPADALGRLLDALAAMDAGGGARPVPGRPPFPGLAAFDVADRAAYFGRERETGELAAEVRARVAQRRPRALLVVGASGSGKSSLVRAGLVPRLLDDPAWWRVEPFAPGESPLGALAAALAAARREAGLPADRAALRAAMATALPATLDDEAWAILDAAPGRRRQLLLVVDQLEELFTRATGEAAAFLRLIAEAASAPNGPVSVVATLRSEFVGDLLRVPEAAPLSARPVLLPPMGRAHLPDVIARPARLVGVTFDEVVVRRLVDDTGTGEALPLLAFTLERLADGVPPGGRVDEARYDALGGVRQAVASQAERVLGTLVGGDLTAGRVMDALLAFVTLDDRGRPTRRRRRRAELPDDVRPIVDAFVDARLLTADRDGADAVVGVTHETLFTAWQRMADARSCGTSRAAPRCNRSAVGTSAYHPTARWSRWPTSPRCK